MIDQSSHFNLIFEELFGLFCVIDCSSAVFEMGNTKVIAAVYGPREVLCFLINKNSLFVFKSILMFTVVISDFECNCTL